MPRRWECRSSGSTRAAAIFFLISTPRCRFRRYGGRCHCSAGMTAATYSPRSTRDRNGGATTSPGDFVISFFERLARPLLRFLDPEDAHGLTIAMLKLAPPLAALRDDGRLATRVFGLNFPNPVGVAAGLDKNAEVPDALLRFGFGFVEVGTITPLPQRGNPRPRLFRLEADGGVIKRLGFNSQGADAVL